ncbi:MAG TPA: flagellar hook capping FlgD N-terminal domain-containing protein [Bryobacteraceae bacterium]|nr:flagellar hook capping FlgD N-terminal domain-containing protein [Bryobacteraceae bacterium]
MASAVNPLTGTSSTASNTGTSSTDSSTSAPTEEMFLQLLVAQLQNQDPLNPTDSTQFVAELAQFSELEQVIAIRNDIEQSASTTTPAATPAGTTPSSSTGSQN